MNETFGYTERKIRRLEAFDVRFLSKGRDIRSDKEVPIIWSQVRASAGEERVSDWISNRNPYQCMGVDVQVLMGDGAPAHGNTKLKTVRESYKKNREKSPIRYKN